MSGFTNINQRTVLNQNEIKIDSAGVLKFSSLFIKRGCKAVIGYNESTHQLAIQLYNEGSPVPAGARPFKKNALNLKSFLAQINALPQQSYVEQFVEHNGWLIINLK